MHEKLKINEDLILMSRVSINTFIHTVRDIIQKEMD